MSARLRAEPPPLSVDIGVPPDLQAAPAADPVALPDRGSLVVEASAPRLGDGTPTRLASLAPDAVRPIASVAKTLTALVVLDAMPLGVGQSGPVHTMNATDVALYRSAVDAGGSNFPVRLGQHVSERDLLVGLMLPSADNYAETLALIVSGDRATFLQRLNARARGLGMTQTTVTDPSGLDPTTTSTASDLVKLGRAALTSPTLASIVIMPRAVIANGVTVTNFDRDLSMPGWLGIKTGSDDAALGCLLFAARRQPAGDGDPADAVTIVGAVLGQGAVQDPESQLAESAGAAARAVDSAAAHVHRFDPVSATPAVSGGLSSPWGARAEVTLGQPDPDIAPALLIGGSQVTLTSSPTVPRPPVTRGQTVGTVEARSGSVVVGRWPVLAGGDVPEPSWTYRLFGLHDG